MRFWLTWMRPSRFGKRKGIKSLLDHALISKNVAASEITYIREPVDLGLTDHSAILVDIELT